MSKAIVAANWKLNKNPQESASFVAEFLETIAEQDQQQYFIFPPALNLLAISEQLAASSVHFGLQNCYVESAGAFTGENSAQVAKAVGASSCLIGHSERRSLFGESDEMINKKFLHLQQLDLLPILCVGETLAQREAGETNEVIGEQLQQALVGADLSKKYIVAYEPVWAIGTGKVATPEMAEEAHQFLHEKLGQLAGQKSYHRPLLYGGSVKPGNAKSLFAMPHIDGFLVGGASLEVSSFVGIFQACTDSN